MLGLFTAFDGELGNCQRGLGNLWIVGNRKILLPWICDVIRCLVASMIGHTLTIGYVS